MTGRMCSGEAFALLDKGSLEELKRALEQGKIDVNLAERIYGKTLLMHAALFRPDAVDILLEKGARLEDRDKDGNTALILAAESDARSVEKLVKAGACVNAKNNYGNSPLALAVICCTCDAVPILLDAGADVNVRDMHGYVSSTPIALAQREASWSGAKRNEADEDPVRVDYVSLVGMLVSAGSKHLPGREETKRAVEDLVNKFCRLAIQAEDDMRKLELDVRDVSISGGRPFFERMLMSTAREEVFSRAGGENELEGLAEIMSRACGVNGEMDRESVYYKAVVEYIDDYMDGEAGRTMLREIERMSAEMADEK